MERITEEIGMTAEHTVKLVNPVGQRAVERVALARRLDTLHGKSIGFIDNMKPNANLFIQYIEEMMRADYTEIQTHSVRKNYTSSKLIADELDGKVQCLVNAWGD
ncbi:MAG: hypothetical protein A3F74_26210 [Betaproteobacteria bacterium RIFCSPLOWO2_12_FULL_62_58]|nr:MAG: hypothetical protein A3F74_26210 [Betaproteobacteria bacterium RIFCSPLOWO2_12_FULL_62_58]